VICGREDRRTPAAAHEELAGQIPGARLRVIERAAHFTPIKEPQAAACSLRDCLQVTS
jgi:pimeloyl-ACP methyl ester carboxylesterase